MKRIVLALASIALAGCASMMPAPVSQIDALPVIKMGSARPAGGEYVLYIPANSPIPVNLNAQGTLLQQAQTSMGTMTLNQDVYLYKYWASHDRKEWKNSHTLLNVSFNGGMDIAGLNVNVKLDKN